MLFNLIENLKERIAFYKQMRDANSPGRKYHYLRKTRRQNRKYYRG